MRLFHVSEEDDISVFVPRIPTRKDLDQSRGLVWASAKFQSSSMGSMEPQAITGCISSVLSMISIDN